MPRMVWGSGDSELGHGAKWRRSSWRKGKWEALSAAEEKPASARALRALGSVGKQVERGESGASRMGVREGGEMVREGRGR